MVQTCRPIRIHIEPNIRNDLTWQPDNTVCKYFIHFIAPDIKFSECPAVQLALSRFWVEQRVMVQAVGGTVLNSTFGYTSEYKMNILQYQTLLFIFINFKNGLNVILGYNFILAEKKRKNRYGTCCGTETDADRTKPHFLDLTAQVKTT